MRYANDGSLTDYITKKFKYLKWKHKLRILYSIMAGLNKHHSSRETCTS